jgi:hypothetical protein
MGVVLILGIPHVLLEEALVERVLSSARAAVLWDSVVMSAAPSDYQQHSVVSLDLNLQLCVYL